ncbi:MAG: sodium/glutamate symporter [Candidatus Xenobium sp.]|nr:sodium:glutamate symporter [Burkholderiales bacterium]
MDKPELDIESLFFSVCMLSLFLLIGKLMRVKIRLFQTLFLPSSIIAGFVALAVGPFMLGALTQKHLGFTIIPDWMFQQWSRLPGILINIVFASLFLGVAIPRPRELWSVGGPQLCFGVVFGMGQYLVGLVVTMLILAPLFGTPAIFATILEVGFSGGHGTAAGMAETFDKMGFPAGGALGQMSATVGILVAVVFGIILVNIAIKKGYCACLNEEKGIPTYKRTGLIPEPQERFSIATATVATEAIEPLTFHFGIIGIAVILGYGMLAVVKGIHPVLQAFPLFPLAMIGGILVQGASMAFKVDHYYDRDTFDRILGISLDMLVISAIATIRMNLFYENLGPFLILMAAGVLWAIFCTVVVAPRMFPEFWFERGITEFGMQTGVTAMGLLLLRIVDPLYRTGTATAFGFKQMIYEPFLGGGLITALAPILIVTVWGPWPTALVSALIMAIFFLIAWFSGWVRLKPRLKYEG